MKSRTRDLSLKSLPEDLCSGFLCPGSFSVNDPSLTTFYYVEKRNGMLRKNRVEGFEKSYVPLHEGGGGVSKIAKIILT